MNIFEKAFCRIFQAGMRVGMKILNFREPAIIHGLDKLPDAVVKEGLTSVLIVTDDVLHNKLKMIDGLETGTGRKGNKILYIRQNRSQPHDNEHRRRIRNV